MWYFLQMPITQKNFLGINFPIAHTHICYTKELFPNYLCNHFGPYSIGGIARCPAIPRKLRAARVQNEFAPEKFLNRYEKRFEKREKGSEKRSETRLKNF